MKNCCEIVVIVRRSLIRATKPALRLVHIVDRLIPVFTALLISASAACAVDSFDIVSGVITSPRFKDKHPLEKLMLAADLFRSNALKQKDLSFLLLDWADRYVREPKDPLKRLENWSKLAENEKLRNIRIPRDFLNRRLLAEYLITREDYQTAQPDRKLEILKILSEKKLVDWSVALAYARIYAGVVILGARDGLQGRPMDCLRNLEKLTANKLIGWHYRVPTEAVLAAEALAMDAEYRNGSPLQRLGKLRDLEEKNLLSPVNRKELEKLPAWRLLTDDPTFLKAAPNEKKQRIEQLRSDKLISQSTESDLLAIFRLNPPSAGEQEILTPTQRIPATSN